MNVADVKAQIQSGNLNHVYIFTGEEIEVQRIYINHIAERSKTSIQRIDSIDSILDTLKRKSLLNRNLCVVVRDDKSFMQDEKLQDTIKSIIGDNILILIYTNLDKRTKFYKKYSKDIVDFELLSEQLLVKYIQKEIPLSLKNCKKLIEVCESNYGRILLEIDKIKKYTFAYYNGHELKVGCYDKSFITLLDDGTIYQPPKDAVFDFVDAVLRRQVNRAFDLLEQSYAVGEATMVLLTVLYNNTRQVLQVQSCESTDIVKSTGLTQWQIKCAKEKMGKYSVGELVRILKLVQFVESGIKSGKIDEDNAMRYILVKIL